MKRFGRGDAVILAVGGCTARVRRKGRSDGDGWGWNRAGWAGEGGGNLRVVLSGITNGTVRGYCGDDDGIGARTRSLSARF
jgi:hypothetical protein